MKALLVLALFSVLAVIEASTSEPSSSDPTSEQPPPTTPTPTTATNTTSPTITPTTTETTTLPPVTEMTTQAPTTAVTTTPTPPPTTTETTTLPPVTQMTTHQPIISTMTTSTTSVHAAYNCNRLGDCKNNGGTCKADGTCTCSKTGNTYFNCQYDTTGTHCTTNACQNGGTCLNPTGTPVCACPYGFYGNNCEIHQADIVCGLSTSEFKITLPSGFNGIVQVDPKTTGAACTPAENTTIVGLKQYSVTFDLSSPGKGNCPSSNLVTNNSSGNTNYVAKFLVHYNALLTTSVDEVYTLTCTHAGRNVTVSKEITDIQVNIANLDPVTKTKEISPVVGMALRKGGAELTGPLFVGEKFELVINVDNTDAFANVLIENCAANDTKSTNPATYPFFDKGCPTTESKTFIGEQVKNGSARSITIKAFKFRDSQKLGIVCTVRLCKQGDNTCTVPGNCESDRTDLQGKRNKRDADDNSEETLSTVVTVLIPGETVTVTNYEEKANAAATTGTCLAQTSIVSVVAILGSLMHTLW